MKPTQEAEPREGASMPIKRLTLQRETVRVLRVRSGLQTGQDIKPVNPTTNPSQPSLPSASNSSSGVTPFIATGPGG